MNKTAVERGPQNEEPTRDNFIADFSLRVFTPAYRCRHKDVTTFCRYHRVHQYNTIGGSPLPPPLYNTTAANEALRGWVPVWKHKYYIRPNRNPRPKTAPYSVAAPYAVRGSA